MVQRKMTDADAAEVRRLYGCTRLSFREIGEMFGVSKWTIRRIVNDETYKPAPPKEAEELVDCSDNGRGS